MIETPVSQYSKENSDIMFLKNELVEADYILNNETFR